MRTSAETRVRRPLFSRPARGERGVITRCLCIECSSPALRGQAKSADVTHVPEAVPAGPEEMGGVPERLHLGHAAPALLVVNRHFENLAGVLRSPEEQIEV